MRTASSQSPTRRSPETTTRSRRPPSHPSEDDASPEDVTSVEVEMTPEQIEWLRQKAESHDVSLSAVLRAVVDEQAGPRTSQKRPAETSANEASTNEASAGGPPEPSSSDAAERGGGADSLLDDLKTAQERLESLVGGNEEDSEDDGPNANLQSLVDRLDDRTSPEDTGQTDDGPSPLEEGLAALEEGTAAGTDSGEEEEGEVNSLFDVPDDT